MASVRWSRSLRASLFSLPPNLRIYVHQHSAISRSFSGTASRYQWTDKASALADTVSNQVLAVSTAIPSGVLDTLHAIGLPWWAVIPTSAVLVRGVFVYFFITKRLRRYAQIQRQLLPLVSARTLMLSQTPEVRSNILSYAVGLRRAASLFTRFRIVEQSAIQLGKQFHAPRFYRNWRPYANFGVLIVMMEAIRIKCGARVGLLSAFASALQWTWGKTQAFAIWGYDALPLFRNQRAIPDTPENSPAGPNAMEDNLVPESISSESNALDHDDLGSDLQTITIPTRTDGFSADMIAAARESTSDPAVLNALAKLEGTSSTPHVVPTYAEHMDPALQTEGFFWVTDLTAADPYHFFPALAALILAAQIAIRPFQSSTRSQTTTGVIPAVDSSQPTIPQDVHSAVQEFIQTLPTDLQNAVLGKLFSHPGAQREFAKMSPDRQWSALMDAHLSSLYSTITPARKLSWRVILAVPISGLFYAFVAVKLPTGLLLYLITSMTIGWGQARWLDYSMPLPPNIAPCRRTLRSKVRKEVSDF